MQVSDCCFTSISLHRYSVRTTQFRELSTLNNIHQINFVDRFFNNMPFGDELKRTFFTRELGRKAREEEERLRKLAEEGHAIYQDYVKQGQEVLREKKVSVSSLTREDFHVGNVPTLDNVCSLANKFPIAADTS